MRDKFVFAVEGLENIQQFAAEQANIEMTMVQAINTTLRDTRAAASDRIRAQVNFSAEYLNPSQKRLFVNKQAKRGDLEGSILARGRPTSLARFITGSAPGRGTGVSVMVHPGRARFMKKAFLIKLRAGTDSIETRFNQGLAIRLRPGETLQNKKNVVQLKNGLFVLYGPSVSQVFLDNQGDGVAKDLEPHVLDELEDQFLRLLEVNKNK
jgi:hypothetical protein